MCSSAETKQRRTFLRNTAAGGLGLLIVRDSRSARTYAADEKPNDWSWWPGPTPPEVRDTLIKPWGLFPNEQQLKQMKEAAPDKAPAAPEKPRRVLVWGRLWTHPGDPSCQEAMKIIGKKGGAFEVVASDDPRLLLPESLKAQGPGIDRGQRRQHAPLADVFGRC